MNFNYLEFLNLKVKPFAAEIDTNPTLLSQTLRSLADGLRHDKSEIPFKRNDLELLFGASTALAFTFWQHLALVERLDTLEDWKRRNSPTWNDLKQFRTLAGLATTHLGLPNGGELSGMKTNFGYLITGTAPWVCGQDIFEKLFVGFNSGDDVVFALIDYPQKNLVKIEPHNMSCLMGTNTVKIAFENFLIPETAIVQIKNRSTISQSSRPTQYIVPEIGIGKSVLEKIQKIVGASEHPKHKIINSHLFNLANRINELDRLREANSNWDELIVLRDNINHDAVRLYAIALGAKALALDCEIHRIYGELILLDTVIHSPTALEKKIRRISSSGG